jgi:diguanylate cyclase (GGDEF)-like protein
MDKLHLRFGLRAQLLMVFAIILLLICLVFALLWQYEKANHQELLALTKKAMVRLDKDGLEQRCIVLARKASRPLAAWVFQQQRSSIHQHLQAIKQQPDVVYAMVYDQKGIVIADADAAKNMQSEQAMVDPMASLAMSSNKIELQWNEKLLDVSLPLFIDEQRVGGLRVGVVLNDQHLDNANLLDPIEQNLKGTNERHWRWFIASLSLIFLIAALCLYLLERRVIIPVRELSLASDQMEQGKYSEVNISSVRRDEIGNLTRAFSKMSAGVERHDREIRRLAYTDSLTGLANRFAFRENLESRLLTMQANSGELAILFIDIDDFKRINDSMGHEPGDEALTQLAARINAIVAEHGSPGSEVARFGGDAFIIIFIADDIRNIVADLAEQLLQEIRKPMLIRTTSLHLTSSIGISMSPFDAEGANALLKNADIAMYQAKVAGKNCYRFYSRAIDEAFEQRIKLEQALRGAFERGEMSLLYQPIYSLADGRLVGAEALMRWQHPDLGTVPPATFIEIAEQSGLIDMIGRNALLLACHDAASWVKPNQHLPFISVNVSPKQLRGGELEDIVQTALASTGLKSSQLHLEITETAILTDETLTSAVLARIRASGVKVWLDDFGTGFSGLSHLRRVPVDGVKIDRSFVADLLVDPDDLALTTAIIAMAHSLGITVVAEGIESEGQQAVLRERGCDHGQGFWLGKPMHSDEILKLFFK